MVNKFISLGAGILGSAFGLCMYGAPIGTFRRVLERKTTGDLSGIPYVIGLFNCLVYTWYGSPLISQGWDNVLVMAINGIGLLLECFFVVIFLLYAPPNFKRRMVVMVIGAWMVFVSMAAVSIWALNDHAHKQQLVGSTGMVATAILYGSPLSDIRMVLRTKSVEYMSFYFSLFSFLGSVLWLVYGALCKDILIMAPNFLGIPLALAQILLYCAYKHGGQKKLGRVEVAKEVGELEIGHVQLGKDKETVQTKRSTCEEEAEVEIGTES